MQLPTDTQLEKVADPEAFLQTDGPWDQLLARSEHDTIFQRGTWLWTVWQVFHDDGDIALFAVRQKDQVVAAAAFQVLNGVVRFLGTGPSDYLDFVVDRQLDDAAKQNCKVALAQGVIQWTAGFREMLLKNVPLRFGTHRQLATGPWHLNALRSTVAPAMRMEAATEALRKKSIRRHFNKLTKAGKLDQITYQTAEEIVPKLPAFFDQHVQRWEETPTPSLFRHTQQRQFFTELVINLAPANLLRFTEIRLDGKLVAAHLGFMYRGIFTWYKPTYDPAFSKFSPGEVLLKTLIEQAVQENASLFDFTIGDEAFKYRFANITPEVEDLHITRSFLTATKLGLLLRAKRVLRESLSRFGVWQKLKSLLGRQ